MSRKGSRFEFSFVWESRPFVCLSWSTVMNEKWLTILGIAMTVSIAGCDKAGMMEPGGAPASRSADFQRGYDAGCEAGYEESMRSFDEGYAHNRPPALGDDYEKGWEQGFYTCRSRPDVLRRSSNRRNR